MIVSVIGIPQGFGLIQNAAIHSPPNSYTARGSKFSFFRRVIGYTKALFSGMLE